MITESDPYPLPNIADVTSKPHGARIFQQAGSPDGVLPSSFLPKDIPNTAIIIPFGNNTLNYSCFDLRNFGRHLSTVDGW